MDEPESAAPQPPPVEPPAADLEAASHPAPEGPSPEAATPEARPSADLGWAATAAPTGVPRRRLTGLPLVGTIAVAAVVGAIVFVAAQRGLAQITGANDPAFVLGNDVIQHLTPDARDRLKARLDTVLGDRTKGMTASQAAGTTSKLTASGYLRLDDQHHIRRLALLTQALAASDATTCAAVARAGFGGTKPDAALAVKVILNLDSASVEEWENLAIDAMQAELAGAPPPRSVSDAEAKAMYQRLGSQMDAATARLIGRVSQNPAIVSDADICTAFRALYRAGSAASPSDAVLFSLVDLGA